jgi:hypothetical protein
MPEPGGLPRHGTHSSWSRHMSGWWFRYYT